LGLIAREASGSMRDALSLIDQVMSCAPSDITQEQVLDVLGVLDRNILFSMSKAVLHKGIPEILDILDEVYNAGHDMKKFYADLSEHFRNLLVLGMGKNTEKLIDLPLHEISLMKEQIKDVSPTLLSQMFNLLFQEEGMVNHSAHPKLAIEMVFLKMIHTKPALPIDVLIEKLDTLRKDICAEQETSNIVKDKQAYRDDKENSYQASAETAGTAEDLSPFIPESSQPDDNYDRIWHQLLSIFLKKNPSLAANLKNATITFMDDQRLEIEVNGNEFNISMVRKEKNIAIIKQTCSKFFGKDVDVTIKVKKEQNNDARDKKNQADLIKREALNHPLVADAVEIFDGKVVDIKIL
jgi:DNA polymerase-3 subunit gamma/tau